MPLSNMAYAVSSRLPEAARLWLSRTGRPSSASPRLRNQARPSLKHPLGI